MLCGLAYNMWGYPFDAIKTNMQSGKFNKLGELIRSKFWKGRNFKQGLLVSLLRGLLVDSSNLLVYERSRNFA
jgi:hypothetical protein